MPLRYQIADLRLDDTASQNYKLFNIGAGILLEFRRYNNFGFNFGVEFTHYDVDGVNEINGLTNPENFWTSHYEAEVYYFPGDTKKQSVFLRLKAYTENAPDYGEAFYQLQFGYRFSIGVGKLKG
jgi:hypothetical protein